MDFFCLEVDDAIEIISLGKAKPFKQWLAKVGYERMQEIGSAKQSINRVQGKLAEIRQTKITI